MVNTADYTILRVTGLKRATHNEPLRLEVVSNGFGFVGKGFHAAVVMGLTSRKGGFLAAPSRRKSIQPTIAQSARDY